MAGAARTTYIPVLLPIMHQPHSSDRDLKEGSTHGDLPMGREEVPRVERYALCSIHREGLPIAAVHVVVVLPSPSTSSPPGHLHIILFPPPPQSSSPARGSPCMGNRQREAVHGGRSEQRPDWYCSSPCCVMVGDRIEQWGPRCERKEEGVEGRRKKKRPNEHVKIGECLETSSKHKTVTRRSHKRVTCHNINQNSTTRCNYREQSQQSEGKTFKNR
jgi:hypothetical protein